MRQRGEISWPKLTPGRRPRIRGPEIQISFRFPQPNARPFAVFLNEDPPADSNAVTILAAVEARPRIRPSRALKFSQWSDRGRRTAASLLRPCEKRAVPL